VLEVFAITAAGSNLDIIKAIPVADGKVYPTAEEVLGRRYSPLFLRCPEDAQVRIPVDTALEPVPAKSEATS